MRQGCICLVRSGFKRVKHALFAVVNRPNPDAAAPRTAVTTVAPQDLATTAPTHMAMQALSMPTRIAVAMAPADPPIAAVPPSAIPNVDAATIAAPMKMRPTVAANSPVAAADPYNQAIELTDALKAAGGCCGGRGRSKGDGR